MSTPQEKPIPRKRLRLALVAGAVVAIALLAVFLLSAKARFVGGGALVNLGYRLQDPIEAFDFDHDEAIAPEQVWNEVQEQNRLASSVRAKFPRTPRHPLVAMVVCMDGRVDTNELAGDTRERYYVIRTAGSVIGDEESEMIELAVANGVKVVVLTTHSDCAAEKVAADPEKRKVYPKLSAAIDSREARIAALLARPVIASKIERGELVVKRMNVETMTERMGVLHK